jgi:hypothetical protein
MECPSSYGFIELTSRQSKENPFLRREARVPRKWVLLHPAHMWKREDQKMGSIVQDGFNANARILYFSTFTKFRLFQYRIVKAFRNKRNR